MAARGRRRLRDRAPSEVTAGGAARYVEVMRRSLGK
jgi:hypothetical protein